MIRGIEAMRHTNGDMAEAGRVYAAVLRISIGDCVSTTNGTRSYDPTFFQSPCRVASIEGKTDLEIRK